MKIQLLTLMLLCTQNSIHGLSKIFSSQPKTLLEAVERNDLSACKLFIAGGADIDATNLYGTTPLHIAVKNGHEAICRLLIEKGADIDASHKYGRAPLHIAVENGREAICRLLIEKGSDIDASHKYGRVPLHIAVENGREAICRLLIEKNADLEARGSRLRMASLHQACCRGNVQVCRLLIEKKAVLDAKDENKKTPLHWACALGDEAVCSLLVEKKADVGARDVQGHTPLMEAACSKKYATICTLLLEKGANLEDRQSMGSTALHMACERNLKSVCRFLLEEGADIEARARWGGTPLHRAVREFRSTTPFDNVLTEDVLVLLIKKGANIDAKTSDGRTPLHKASRPFHYYGGGLLNKHYYSEILLDNGAQIDVQDEDGKTPLHLAAENRNEEVCWLLVNRGADINIRDNKGATPLMLYCEEGFSDSPKILTLLCRHPRIIKELKDDVLEGTALHWACKADKLSFCKELINSGFDVNETANTDSLLHIAVKKDSLPLIELFLEKQADRNAFDKEGNTPLHICCRKNNINAVEKLLLRKRSLNMALDLQNKALQTPLHIAVQGEYNEIVDLLLKYGAAPHMQDMHNKTPIMYAAELKNLEICMLLKKKISVVEFNIVRRPAGALVGGHKELESLFGVYDFVPPAGVNASTFAERASIEKSNLPVGTEKLSDTTTKKDRGVLLEYLVEPEQNQKSDTLSVYIPLNVDLESIFSSEHSEIDLFDQVSVDGQHANE